MALSPKFFLFSYDLFLDISYP